MWDAITGLEARLSPTIITLDLDKPAYNAVSEMFTNVTKRMHVSSAQKCIYRNSGYQFCAEKVQEK